jgi:hypothetical protein
MTIVVLFAMSYRPPYPPVGRLGLGHWPDAA